MKNCGRRNVRGKGEINNDNKYIALDIYLKFGNIYKIKITCSEAKYYLVRSGKGLITYLGLKTIIRSKKVKKAKFSINEVSIKDFLRLLRSLRIFLIRIM